MSSQTATIAPFQEVSRNAQLLPQVFGLVAQLGKAEIQALRAYCDGLLGVPSVMQVTAPVVQTTQPYVATPQTQSSVAPGYTRIGKDRVVKNKAPKERSLPEKQARNWRDRVGKTLSETLQAKGLTPDVKTSDPEVVKLREELQSAKDYLRYVKDSLKNKGQPQEVQAWRKAQLVQQPNSAVMAPVVLTTTTPQTSQSAEFGVTSNAIPGRPMSPNGNAVLNSTSALTGQSVETKLPKVATKSLVSLSPEIKNPAPQHNVEKK